MIELKQKLEDKFTLGLAEETVGAWVTIGDVIKSIESILNREIDPALIEERKKVSASSTFEYEDEPFLDAYLKPSEEPREEAPRDPNIPYGCEAPETMYTGPYGLVVP